MLNTGYYFSPQNKVLVFLKMIACKVRGVWRQPQSILQTVAGTMKIEERCRNWVTNQGGPMESESLHLIGRDTGKTECETEVRKRDQNGMVKVSTSVTAFSSF